MVLREFGAPLAGDSSRSIREDSLFARGVALQWDYRQSDEFPGSQNMYEWDQAEVSSQRCWRVLTGVSPLMREDRRRGVGITSQVSKQLY